MTRKQPIEVALPLDAINAACKPETENPFLKGHPRSIHVWWARTPLVACRAVLFTSLVDDPEQPGVPKELLDAIDRLLPDSSGTRSRRERLFDFIGELIHAATGGQPPQCLIHSVDVARYRSKHNVLASRSMRRTSIRSRC